MHGKPPSENTDDDNIAHRKHITSCTCSSGRRRIYEVARRLTRRLGGGGLEELLEDGEALGLLSVIGDNHAGALDNLAGGALGVELAEAGPLAELHSLGHADEVHVDLVAERLDELGVVSLVAVLGEDAQERLAGLDGLL